VRKGRTTMMQRLIRVSSRALRAVSPAGANDRFPAFDFDQQSSNERRRVVVQLALKIELPMEDIDGFRSSGAISISLTRD